MVIRKHSRKYVTFRHNRNEFNSQTTFYFIKFLQTFDNFHGYIFRNIWNHPRWDTMVGLIERFVSSSSFSFYVLSWWSPFQKLQTANMSSLKMEWVKLEWIYMSLINKSAAQQIICIFLSCPFIHILVWNCFLCEESTPPWHPQRPLGYFSFIVIIFIYDFPNCHLVWFITIDMIFRYLHYGSCFNQWQNLSRSTHNKYQFLYWATNSGYFLSCTTMKYFLLRQKAFPKY